MHNEDADTFDIRQYIALLRRWLWLIVLASLLAAGAAFVAGRLATPVYEASSTLLISKGQKAGGTDYNDLLMSERLAKTYAEMLRGQPVLAEVAARLGLPASAEALQALVRAVTVEPVRITQLIRLTVRHADPARAAEIANAIPVVFIDYNAQMQAARFAASLESLDAEMQRLTGEIEATQHELDEVKATGSGDGQQARLEALLAQYRATYAGLLSDYEEIRLAQAREMDSLTVFEPATVPHAPALPRTRTNVLLASVVGAMLAVGAAFLIEYLDDTIKVPENVERVVGMSPMGNIARFADETAGAGPIMAGDPRSAIAEAYRVLRTNVEFSVVGLQRSPVVLLVTGAQPGEGKTTTLANLGVALAQVGKRVLLVDSDMRRPTLHKQFGLPNDRGLTTLYLQRDLNPESVIKETEISGLRVLTSGPIPSNPAEALAYPQTDEMLDGLRALADYVLLDSPPLLSVADAAILAQKADGVLMVVQSGSTRTDAFARAVAALNGVNARLLGVVLNRMAVRPGSYYYHYYQSDGDGPSRRRHRSRALGAAGWRALPAWFARRSGEGRSSFILRLALVLLGVAAVLALAVSALSQGLEPSRASVHPTAVAPAEQPTAAPAAGVQPTAEPTSLPSPTVEVIPSSTAAATATPKPSPTLIVPSPTPERGVSAALRLRDGRTEYAAGEAVYFVLEVQNNRDELTSMGIVGLEAPGMPFRSTWWQVDLGPGAAYNGEDHLVFSEPGTYTVSMAACFSEAGACQETGADWETFPGGVTVTVH